MAAVVKDGVYSWEGSRDKDGHRRFVVEHLVQAATTDGPYIVMNAPGLPSIGSYWLFDSDSDVWAFCTPVCKVSIHKERKGDPNRWWVVEQEFTTRPMIRCQDFNIEDPMLEPDRVSGSFVKYTVEAAFDRFGELVKSSSHEMFRGPQVEFDRNRPTVRIEQNRANLELSLFASMIDTVNDATLWGLGARRVKLSNASWERKVYGVCGFYYVRTFDFDIDYNTFDRDLLDEGTKALNGHWDPDNGHWELDRIGGQPPNPANPQHFSRYKDRNGENARVILDGTGRPADSIVELGTASSTSTSTGTDPSGPAATYHLEYYPESNLLLLGIPTSF